jgi:ATP synthase protein I
MGILGGRGFDFRKIGEISSIGLLLPSSIAVGLFFGYLLDKWLGTHPWMLLIFLVLGVVSGLMSLFRELKKYMNDRDMDDRD